jgi:hypothetical protein
LCFVIQADTNYYCYKSKAKDLLRFSGFEFIAPRNKEFVFRKSLKTDIVAADPTDLVQLI